MFSFLGATTARRRCTCSEDSSFFFFFPKRNPFYFTSPKACDSPLLSHGDIENISAGMLQLQLLYLHLWRRHHCSTGGGRKKWQKLARKKKNAIPAEASTCFS